MIRKYSVEKFIVVRPGTAVPTPGDRLYNFTTDSINIPVGGFGIYRPVANSGNPEATPLTPTVTNTREWQVIMHRDKSMDRSPLSERTFEESAVIRPTCNVSAKGTGARVKNNNLWLVGASNSVSVGNVPVSDETEYIVNVALHGWRTDLYNGLNTPLMMGRFTTPDYFSSTLYTVTNQRRDHLLQNLALNFNENTVGQVVAICIDSTANAPVGAGQGTLVSAVVAGTPGTNIVIGYTDLGQPITLTLSVQIIRTFALAVAAGLPGTAVIVPAARPTGDNLAVATRIVAGGRVAGGTGAVDASVDHIAFLVLDSANAYYQEAPQTKDRIIVGLDGGFNVGTSNRSLVNPSEGAGYASELLQMYIDIEGYRQYPGGKRWQPNHVRYHDEVVENGIYDIFTITSCEEHTASNGLPSVSPRTTIVAILNTETVGFAGYTGVVNPQKTYFQNMINSWMASTTFPHTTISI